jgi:type IV pilus assembly protein PilP
MVAAVADETAEEAEAPTFAYEPAELRDPFQPFIKLDTKTKKKARPQIFVPKTPLQRFATEELHLVGIIWGEGGRARALIEDPQGKGYVVGTGTLVGDRGGRIVRIEPEQAVIEERIVDLFGEENLSVVTMTLRKPEGEVNP